MIGVKKLTFLQLCRCPFLQFEDLNKSEDLKKVFGFPATGGFTWEKKIHLGGSHQNVAQ